MTDKPETTTKHHFEIELDGWDWTDVAELGETTVEGEDFVATIRAGSVDVQEIKQTIKNLMEEL